MQWNKCSDKMPRLGIDVILLYKDTMYVGSLVVDGSFEINDYDGCCGGREHLLPACDYWMELPEKPMGSPIPIMETKVRYGFPRATGKYVSDECKKFRLTQEYRDLKEYYRKKSKTGNSVQSDSKQHDKEDTKK